MKKLVLSIFLLTFLSSYSQENKSKTNLYNLDKKNIAINGYDPVSYFNNKPIKGKSNIRYEYEGVIYFFANENNKQKFAKNSIEYIPQYGGWCAYALGKKSELMDVDPKTYKITNGKLYLFYDSFFSNALDLWNNDEVALIEKANRNWQKLIR